MEYRDFQYALSLKKDLAEQFKDKPYIESLMDVVGKQLQDVFDFLIALIVDRRLEIPDETDKYHDRYAVGKQLDMIGELVCLTRVEAKTIADQIGLPYENEDEVYREMIKYKIFSNTSVCTYQNIMDNIKMFWDGKVYYSEDVTKPATILLDYDRTEAGSSSSLLSIPIIKAGGVRLQITAHEEIDNRIYFGVSSAQSRDTTLTQTEDPPELVLLVLDDTEGQEILLCDEGYNILYEEEE